jgi:hypothetical protein
MTIKTLKKPHNIYFDECPPEIIEYINTIESRLVNSHNLLARIRNTFLVDLDSDGQPCATFHKIMELWDKVNDELEIFKK